MMFGNTRCTQAPPRLNAVSMGRRVPRDRFTGTVHSVFGRACNIELGGGDILVLLADSLGNAPHGVRLAVPAGFAFDRHFAVGQAVGCRAGVLRIGPDAAAIDLRAASTWHVDLRALAIDPGRCRVAGAHAAARRALAALDRKPLGVPAGTARDRLDAVARATRSFAAAEAAAAIGRLIGTGIGLTPSGDDLAVGYLAGLWSTVGTCPRRAALARSLAAAVRGAAGATTAVSRAYLRHAAGGEVAEPLAALAVAIASGAPEGAVRAAVARAAAVGASSGREGVLGLLRGLEAWSAPALSTRETPVRPTAGSGADAMGLAHG